MNALNRKPAVVITQPAQALDYFCDNGALVSISTAAFLAEVTTQRIRFMVQERRRFTDVRLFGVQMVNLPELEDWIHSRP